MAHVPQPYPRTMGDARAYCRSFKLLDEEGGGGEQDSEKMVENNPFMYMVVHLEKKKRQMF